MPPAVALRKESVDRNKSAKGLIATNAASLSARRAWIEIQADRHYQEHRQESLSARRAWIEIAQLTTPEHKVNVALRKESVDRNCRVEKRIP